MYLVYVDQSGDPSLGTRNPSYPVFSLAAVIVLEREYAARVEPQITQLKRAHFGDPAISLNARDITKQHGPFSSLIPREPRRRFDAALSETLHSLPVLVAAACLNKEMHQRQYGLRQGDALSFTLPFIMERLVYLLAGRHDGAAVIVQAQGRKEDAAFREVWRRQLTAGSFYHAPTEFSSRLNKLDA